MAAFAVLKADDSRDMYDEDFDRAEYLDDGHLRIASKRAGGTKKVYAVGWWRELQF